MEVVCLVYIYMNAADDTWVYDAEMLENDPSLNRVYLFPILPDVAAILFL